MCSWRLTGWPRETASTVNETETTAEREKERRRERSSRDVPRQYDYRSRAFVTRHLLTEVPAISWRVKKGDEKLEGRWWPLGRSLRTVRYGVNCDPAKDRVGGSREKFDGETVERELSDSR